MQLSQGYARFMQVVRFALVGVANNLLGYLIYLLITVWVEPKLAVTLLYPIGVLTGYFGHARYAFGYQGNGVHGLARYLMAHLTGYVLNLTLLYVFSDRLGISHQVVQFFAIFVVGAVLFVLCRFWVFRRQHTQDSAGLRGMQQGSSE
jgi:putative flippase GtrA